MAFVETNRIEYKRELTVDIEKCVVAFLNAEGGQIYFGICDDGTILGIDDPNELQLQLKDRIINNIRPGTLGLFDIYVEEREGKQVVVLNLAGGPSIPYYIRKYGRSEKGCFLRIGSSAQPMSEEHIEKLMNQRQVFALSSVVSRRQDLTFHQLKIFYEGYGVVLNKYFAQTLNLKLSDGKYNLLAYLFSDTNDISIRVAKWGGEKKIDLRMNEDYGGCSLVKAMQKVLDKFDIENTTQARKRGMKTREEWRLVDAPSLRELIINAFAHNDYSQGETPIFEIFSNRFEITSYGGLIAGMTIEEFFGGVSRPRNPDIMRIFKDLEYVERLGSGIPAVVEKYGRNIFNFSSSIIRFVIPFSTRLGFDEQTDNISDNKEDNVGEPHENRTITARKPHENRTITAQKPHKNRTKTARKPHENRTITAQKPHDNGDALLIAITKTPTASFSALAKELSLSVQKVRWQIERLKAAGRIRRKGSNRGGYWEIVGN